jgi:cbb3-type cytochrome oxidase subunit 3
VDLKKAGAGSKSLKKYELTNLIFFLTLIAALGVLVSFVFHYYGSGNKKNLDESDMGVVSDALGPDSDVGLFYLSTKLSETSRQYRSRIEIPPTDDGLVRELFAIPGVEEVTIDQRIIIIKKTTSARWEGIRPSVRQIVKNHLHLHY